MDAKVAADLAESCERIWNEMPKDQVVHLADTRDDRLLLQGDAGVFRWPALMLVGPKGGIKGEFVIIDAAASCLADRPTWIGARRGLGAGPLTIPHVETADRGEVIEAARRAIQNLADRHAAGKLTEAAVRKYRDFAACLPPPTSVRPLIGGRFGSG